MDHPVAPNPSWPRRRGTRGKVWSHCATGLMERAAFYLAEARARDERPVDPVARFHLGNGAVIEQLDWGADTSPKGLRQSAGIMVNDFYDLSAVEVRHQAFARHGHVTVGAPFRKLRRSFEGKKANNRVPAEG